MNLRRGKRRTLLHACRYAAASSLWELDHKSNTKLRRRPRRYTTVRFTGFITFLLASIQFTFSLTSLFSTLFSVQQYIIRLFCFPIVFGHHNVISASLFFPQISCFFLYNNNYIHSQNIHASADPLTQKKGKRIQQSIRSIRTHSLSSYHFVTIRLQMHFTGSHILHLAWYRRITMYKRVPASLID